MTTPGGEVNPTNWIFIKAKELETENAKLNTEVKLLRDAVDKSNEALAEDIKAVEELNAALLQIRGKMRSLVGEAEESAAIDHQHMDEFAREFFGDQEGTLWAPGFTLKKLLEMVRDRIGALKNALYAECRGIACSSEECHGGYRRCTGCEVRAKAAFGPGWQEFVVNRSEGCQKCGAPVGSLHSLYCKA